MKPKSIYSQLVGLSLGLLAIMPNNAVASSASTSKIVEKGLSYCKTQVEKSIETLKEKDGGSIDYTLIPRDIPTNSTEWQRRKAVKEEWCGGFWPGILWYDYEATKDERIKAEADKYTQSLGFLSQIPAYDHDLGFLIFSSFGNGYRLTHREDYKKVIIDTADSLATLFNPTVGTILSWPREVKNRNWPHNTIMDNMINLELLFWAAKHGGENERKLYDIAVSHADKTMLNQFRPDYTSYHVAVYDTITGKLIKGVTHQGYSDNSMWARGQAWAIYGFTMVYRKTKDPKYLDFVQHVTDVYLNRLPKDYVPYWDFSDPKIPNTYRDASSASIVASALLELSTYLVGNKGTEYRAAALKMLKSLGSKTYQCRKSNPAFLKHSVGNMPAGTDIDVAISYADYYYIEALLRLRNLEEGKSVVEE